MATRGTAGEFVRFLSQATSMGVLKLINKKQADMVARSLSLAAEGLDYSQAVLNVIGSKASVNPVMNAIVDAFNRRRFAGTFRYGGQSVELDTLLNERAMFPEDSDTRVAQRESTQAGRGSTGSDQICFLFQANKCNWTKCRFRHACSICNSPNHGRDACPKHTGEKTNKQKHQTSRDRDERRDRPPHPRTRRDRARNGD